MCLGEREQIIEKIYSQLYGMCQILWVCMDGVYVLGEYVTRREIGKEGEGERMKMDKIVNILNISTVYKLKLVPGLNPIRLWLLLAKSNSI